MTYDARRHFDARPAPGGGVTLRLRHRFRDIEGTYLDPDGVARTRNVEQEDAYGSNLSPGRRMGLSQEDWTGDNFLPRSQGVGTSQLSRNQDAGEKVQQTLFVFGPMTEGQSYKFQKLSNGCIAVILVSDPDELIGDTITTNSGTILTELNKGPTAKASMDRAAKFVASGRGSEARKLRTLNQMNKRYFGC